MLETVALCTVLFDYSGIWISYLPGEMKTEVEENIGFDPWSGEVQSAMTKALGTVAESDAMAAWQALHSAEKLYDEMDAAQIVAETLACAERYSAIIEKEE